jgi:hypothetical protein
MKTITITLAVAAFAVSGFASSGCKMKSPMPAAGTDASPTGAPVADATISAPQADMNNESKKPQAPLRVSVATDKPLYKRGETVRFTVTVRNASRETQTLSFSSGRKFDIAVRQNAGTDAPLWNWANGRMFTMMLTDVKLASGESKSWTATWKQTGNDQKELPRGVYSARAQLAANGGIEAAPITVSLAD